MQLIPHSIPVVLSSDENFATYIPVVLQSIKEHALNTDHYDIYIMDCGIAPGTRQSITDDFSNWENAQINFIDVNQYLEKYKDLFVVFSHFTPATYIRFFISDILQQYNKLVYLDIDILVRGNLAVLYNQPIGEHIIGAAVDLAYERQLLNNENELQDYTYNELKLPQTHYTFNAGILIINAEKWREGRYAEKCLTRLKELGEPRLLDQCVMNSICTGDIYYFNPEWNYQWHTDALSIANPSAKIKEVIVQYEAAKENPKIIHFTTSIKPWNLYQKFRANDRQQLQGLETHLATQWWASARKTSLYESMIYRNTFLAGIADQNTRKEKRILSLIRIIEEGKTKRVYFLGLRLIKIIQNKKEKTYYLFSLPFYKKPK